MLPISTQVLRNENWRFSNEDLFSDDKDDTEYKSLRNMTVGNMQEDKCFASGEIGTGC